MPQTRQTLADFLFTDGYVSSAMNALSLPSTFTTYSKNMLMTGMSKSRTYKGSTVVTATGGSRIMMNAAESYAGLGRFADSQGKGSVVKVLSALFFAGAGRLYYNGAAVGSLDASSILQLTTLNSGSYSTTAYQAGLSTPSAPTIAARTSLGTGMTGKMKAGSYSVRISKIRSTTGARSVSSIMSNITVTTETNGVGQSIRVTFPAIGSNGADAWGVYVSQRGFGSTGPHYLLQEVLESALTTVDGTPRSIEIEWSDGDLVGKNLAPIDNDAPPACVFVGALGDCTFVDGCYGDTVTGVSATTPGSTGAISLPYRPEEFPIDWNYFPPDAPTALLRGGDGFYYRFGKNSMGVISYVGGSDTDPPIVYQLFWGTTGINYQHNAVIAEGGRLYAKTGARGLVRIGSDGEPDTSWALPVLDDVESWTDAETVLGWDEDSQTVAICNGTTILPYNSSLDKWGAPIDVSAQVPGNIVSAVTHDGHLYLSCLDTSNSRISVYQFNAGSGSRAELRTDWHNASGESCMIRQIDITGRFDNTNAVTVEVYGNEDATTPVFSTTLTPTATGWQRLNPIRLALPDLSSFAVHLEQTSSGGNAGFEKVSVLGTSRNITR